MVSPALLEDYLRFQSSGAATATWDAQEGGLAYSEVLFYRVSSETRNLTQAYGEKSLRASNFIIEHSEELRPLSTNKQAKLIKDATGCSTTTAKNAIAAAKIQGGKLA